MGSSGGGSGNPGYLSQGAAPMPNLPIAGQGAPNDNPRSFGSFQSFLPDAPAAGGGPAPTARGVTSDMLQYRPPGSGSASGEIDGLRQQLAALQAAAQAGGGAPAAAAGGNGQFGAAGDGSGGGGRSPGFEDWQFTGAHGVPLAPRPAGWG